MVIKILLATINKHRYLTLNIRIVTLSLPHKTIVIELLLKMAISTFFRYFSFSSESGKLTVDLASEARIPKNKA